MALLGFTSSSTDYLYRPLAWPADGPRPWFYSAWINYGSFSGITGPLQFTSLAALSQNVAPRVGLRNTGSASGWLGADQDDAGGNGNLTPTFTATAGQWFHHATNLSGQASREYFFGGVSKGSSTTSIGTQTLQALQVGFGIGGSLPSSAAVAEIVVGTGILSKDQVAALAAGRNPLSVLNPAQIVCYYPLRGDVRDYGLNGPVGLIPTGANSSAAIRNNWTAHPPVAPVRNRRLLTVAAAGGGSVGTATGSGAASGVGASLVASTGTATGAGAASGVGASLRAAVGTASGSGSASGVGASNAAATGTASGTSTASGVSPGGTPAVGTASGAATVSGVGASIRAAVGTASGSSTATGIAPGGVRRSLVFVVT